MSMKLSRPEYAVQYGPTKGDKIHLADTGLVVEIEHDFTTYGDEMVFGGGKTIRDGMGQASKWKSRDGALDLVVTNAVIIDPVLGVVKGDIGIKDGKIVGVGKAGNPDTMDITPGLIVAPATDILSVEGMIVTPGFLDIHPHFDSVQQLYEYQNAGFTTVIGGGSGPKTVGIECPGAFNLHRMLEAMADIPLNFGNFGKGNASTKGAIEEQIVLGGATGLKIHEDWSSSPAAIEACMELADEYDFQVQIHADTLNETGYYEDTMAAINGRVMHIYHAEGAGGGNAPDIMRCVMEPNCLPSSTNPTNPFSINTYDEEIDMLITCHNLNKAVPTDMAFIQGRARAETMRAEDVLHDLGAISMIGSDSQGVGRAAESAQRAFQLAAVSKQRFGKLPEDAPGNDNFRVRRYLSKVTINPAITFGVDSYVGSITPGKLADLVFWLPKFFIAKPELTVKGGFITHGAMGDPAGSLMTGQPLKYRPQYGALGANPGRLSYSFVTQAALDAGLHNRLRSHQTLMPVKNTRTISKRDMYLNNSMPDVEIDPETYNVYVDGRRATVKPARTLPLTQLFYFR
ncbi:urease subunit alpha [Pontibaca methylaminivorans]|uniref:Urease subunit alpha n=1 Tax=Pontibaca methylaminivorans TaxID=515897 RepID=A0A1R3WWD5_9RHOB|nr:urease subunit alpha [Pontibaca methylaminivorans]SIT82734.1 urease subunit alpha [Pontibaca methylaminivorans]